MKVKFRRRSQVMRMVLAGLCFSSLFLPIRASASLGGDVASVEADQQQMNAKRAVKTSGKYSVHEITTSYGLWCGNMFRRMERSSAWHGEGRFFPTSSKFWASTTENLCKPLRMPGLRSLGVRATRR